MTFALVACAPLQPGNLPVSGRIHSVTAEDLRAAITADKLASINPNVPYEPYYLSVINSDEIHVYHKTHSDFKLFSVVRRVGNHWEVTKIGVESDRPI